MKQAINCDIRFILLDLGHNFHFSFKIILENTETLI